MPFALLIIGLLLIATGGRGTYAQFGAMVVGDFTQAPAGGGPTFTTWLIALAAVGVLGYIPQVQTISRMLLALVLLVLLLRNRGFFDQFQAALKQGAVQPAALPAAANSGSEPGAQAGSAIAPFTAPSAGAVNQWLQQNFGSFFSPTWTPQGVTSTPPVPPGSTVIPF